MNTTQARKLSFEEAWNSTTVFFVDEALEAEIDREIDWLLLLAGGQQGAAVGGFSLDELASFLAQAANALDVVLYDTGLSEEKLLRIVSLLRILGRIPGGFDQEWSVKRIKKTIAADASFARLIADLLMNGARDPELATHIPRYYLETLNYRDIQGGSAAARRARYKRALIGTYGGRKGYAVEARIQSKLEDIQRSHGVTFGKGQSRLIEFRIDFALPSAEDPWVMIMSSFQETTSSGQSTKTRDMRTAYERVRASNSRFNETRAFVNLVDGGGWLARKSDFARLVDECHYFINLRHLDMLEAIIERHVPPRLRRI
jgi:hypothetical protein